MASVNAAILGSSLSQHAGVGAITCRNDVDVIHNRIEKADGIVLTAFGPEFSNHAKSCQEDRAAIENLAEVFV